MRVRSLADLGKALAERPKPAPEPVRAGLPVPYTPRPARSRVPSMDTTRDNRVAFLISEGTRYYEEPTTRKQREGDDLKVYTGPRFAPPKLKPVPGRGY